MTAIRLDIGFLAISNCLVPDIRKNFCDKLIAVPYVNGVSN